MIDYCHCPIEDWRDIPDGWCYVCGKPSHYSSVKPNPYLANPKNLSQTYPCDALNKKSRAWVNLSTLEKRLFYTVSDRERQRDAADAGEKRAADRVEYVERELEMKEEARRRWAETAAKFHAERDELQRQYDDERKFIEEIEQALGASTQGSAGFDILAKIDELQRQLSEIRSIVIPSSPEADLVENIRTGWQAFTDQINECAELQRQLAECAKMLRRGQRACERQGWEKGESTEAWYHAAGQLASIIEIAQRDAAKEGK